MLLVQQYRELNQATDGGVFDKMIHAVSVIFNLDPTEVQEWEGDKLVSKYQEARKRVQISERYSESITIEGTQLKLLDFKNLTLGQFIDLESLVSKGFVENLHNIAASIYLIHEGGGMYEDLVEEYAKINIGYRANLIDFLPLNSIYGACNKYLKFRENFFNSYDLFNDPLEGFNPDEATEEELAIYEEEKKLRDKAGKNQWETMLNLLTGNDITKFDEVLKMNLFLTFNQVTYIKSTKS